MGEIRTLNTLRGLAALIVVISHYSNSTGFFGALFGRGAGQIGVMLFFMLSGFLMSYLYIFIEPSSNNIKPYLISRIARVVPLFVIIIITSYLLRIFDIRGVLYNISDFNTLLSHLLLLYGKSVFWTIPTEIFFYLFFIIIWVMWHINFKLTLLLIFVGGVLLLLLDLTPEKGNFFGLTYHFHFLKSLPFFLAGMILGVIKRNLLFPSLPTSIFAPMVFLLIPLIYPNIFSVVFGFKHQMWNSPIVFVTLSLVFFVVVFVVQEKSRLLENTLGDFLGRISYSVYLLHLPVLFQFKPLAKQAPELFILPYLAVTIFVSFLSYTIIENPLRILVKQHLTKSKVSQTHL